MQRQHLYLLGLDDPILAGLAVALKQLGFGITGTGENIPKEIRSYLVLAGIHLAEKYDIDHLHSGLIVVVAPGIAKTNSEFKQAIHLKLELLSASQLVEQLTQTQRRIVVTGGPLRSDILGRLAWTLTLSNSQPDVIAGRVIKNIQANVRYTGQAVVLIEAAIESAAIFDKISALEYAHPDTLIIAPFSDGQPRPPRYIERLQQIAGELPEQALCLVADTDREVMDMLKLNGRNYRCYGQTDLAATKIEGINYQPDRVIFWVSQDEMPVEITALQPGSDSFYASLAAIEAAKVEGIDLDTIAAKLANYAGLGRQLDIVGTVNGVTVFDSAETADRQIEVLIALARHRYHLGKLWLLYVAKAGESDQIALLAARPILGTGPDILVVVDNENESKLTAGPATVDWSSIHRATHYRLPLSQAVHFISENITAQDSIMVVDSSPTSRLARMVVHQLTQRWPEAG